MMTALVTLAIVAHTHSASAAPESFTVHSAVTYALEHNLDVQAAREKLNETDAISSAAVSDLFPTIALTANGNYRKDSATNPLALFGAEPYNQYFAGLTLSQPLYAGGALWGAIDSTKSANQIAEANYQIAVRDLTINVIQAFYSVILAEKNVAILDENRQIDEDLVKTINTYHRLGRSQLLDVLQVKTQLAMLVPKIAQARNQVKIAGIQLATILGYRGAPEISVSGDLIEPDRKKFEAAFTGETQRHWENERSSHQLDAVDANRSLLLSKDLPALSLLGTYGRSSYVKTDLLDSSATTWALTLQLSVPIFSGLSSIHERNALASQQKQAEIQKENTEDQSTLTQAQTQKEIDLAQETLVSTKEAFDIAQKAINEAKRQFRLGLTNLINYLQAEQSFLDAETIYYQAKFNYLVALFKYGAARGYSPQKLLAKMENPS
ncbi:MAG: TolC family protein [Bdellovibrionales bacterium]|nr:TolC family protein [Bdellovibrionales bacterium]